MRYAIFCTALFGIIVCQAALAADSPTKLTEPQACTAKELLFGWRPPLSPFSDCYATKADADANRNRVDCVAEEYACCVNPSTLTAQCAPRGVFATFTPAVPDATAVKCPAGSVPAPNTPGKCVLKNEPTLTFTPNVEIPNLFEGTKTVDNTLLVKYLSAFFVYFVGIVGILAVVMMMYGGYHYIVAAGNPSKMTQGKEIISGAMIGLTLALVSFLLLGTINPSLVNFRGILPLYVAERLQPFATITGQPSAATTGCQAEAKQLLQSPRVSFPYRSTCASVQPATEPKAEFKNLAGSDTCTMFALSTDDCTKTHFIAADIKLLKALDELESRNCSFSINAFGGGIHAASSLHYSGKAVDLQKPSGCSIDTLKDALCTKGGIHICDEDEHHFHISTKIPDCPSGSVQIC